MKICYIAPFRDGTGYSNQAVQNVLALEAGGIDVVARAVKLSQSNNNELAAKISHLEDKNTDNVDAVIQHVLPHLFEYKEGIKNIGMFCWETTHFRRSNWSHCCNLMDEIWVPSIQNAQAAKDSNVTVPIKVFPCACDITRFTNRPDKLNIPILENKCVFYVIGEMIRRKNIVAILRAFYSAFSLRDDVVLVIKINVPGKSPNEAIDILKATIDDIKKSLHTYIKHLYYPPVVCITDFLPNQKLDQLHVACNVFVSASHGEAWGIPAHDAMGFGNPVILSNWGSFPELMSPQVDCGWLIRGQMTPCFGAVDSFPDLYTGDELWFDPDIVCLITSMQGAYQEWQDGKLHIKGKAASKRAAEFSYEKVGSIAKRLLEE